MVRMIATRAAFVVVLCSAWVAHASQRRVALLQPDEELLRAVSLALSAWGVETRSSSTSAPDATQEDVVVAAERITRQLGVDAVVWTTNREQPLVWVFDANTSDITTRVLTQAPPFDSVAAASVALTVKTVLRASGLAPAQERSDPGFTHYSPPPPASLQIGASGHWIGEDKFDFRAQLAGMFWFAAHRRLGVSVELSSTGPGLRVENVQFSGVYRELAAGAKARVRLIELPSFFTVIGIGAAVHWALFSGTLLAESQRASVARVNASVDLEASFNFRITKRIYLGALVGAAYFPAYQRYRVRGSSVLAPSPLSANVAGLCGVELF